MEPKHDLLRSIPKVDNLLELAAAEPRLARLPRVHLVACIRQILEELRQEILAGRAGAVPDWPLLADRLQDAAKAALTPSLRPVINATGVVLHTNLGRAVLGAEVAAEVARVASSYSTLEYDPKNGGRGSRHVHVENLLTRLLDCEAAMVVNNNAAAVLLILSALAAGRELIVSRGELVEIGGSFRIPDIMEQGGAILRAVGTTNRTRISDYARAIEPGRTGGLLKVHTSNFRIIGFTEETPVRELADLAASHGLPLISDLGSGTFFSLLPLGITDEPTVRQLLDEGADLVSFSGDKLLGGSQAGIIVGRRDYIGRLKAHPLARALRVDKMTLTALEATLRLYLDPEAAKRSIPTLAMLFAELDQLKNEAERLRGLLAEVPGLMKLEVMPTEGQAGGGSAPERPLASWAVAVDGPADLSVDELEARLRRRETPVVSRIFQDRLLLDVRTIRPDQFEEIARAFREALTPA